MIEEHIDRSQIALTSLEDADDQDIEYWMSRTPAERVEGIEYLRRWLYGAAQIDAGLQRVLELVELERE